MGTRQKNLIKKELLMESKRELEKNIDKDNNVKRDVCVDRYTRYFMDKVSKKMILYDKFPSIDDILDYYFEKSFLADHPLGEYGKFDIKELLEVIKYLYSFYNGEEYNILTFGYLEKSIYHVQEGDFDELKPRLCFLVGNDKTLSDYREYQNLFLGLEKSFDFSRKKESLVVLNPIEGTVSDTLGIYCKEEGQNINNSGLWYYDYLSDEYMRVKYLNIYSLFCQNFYQRINNYSGIEDTLSIRVHSVDQFIAKALISIIIYKKNLGKVNLTNEDYKYIFYQLFQDNSVNIKKSIERDIPKNLKYVKK